MANLLPKPILQSRITNAVVRTSAAFCFVVAIAGALATVGMVPAYLQAHFARVSIENAIVSAATSTAESGGAEIKLAKSQIAALKTITERPRPISEIVQMLLDNRPQGMYIDRLSYKYVAAGSVISLHGQLSDPGVLETYRNALTASGAFTSVKIPVSELAQTQAGTFTLEIAGKW